MTKPCPCCGEVHEPPRTVIQTFEGGHIEAAVGSDGGFDLMRMMNGAQTDGIHVLAKHLPKLKRVLTPRPPRKGKRR